MPGRRAVTRRRTARRRPRLRLPEPVAPTRARRYRRPVTAIRIPPRLRDASQEEGHRERLEWLAALPSVIAEIASEWKLTLGEPYLPGGQVAWVAPARGS